MTDNMYIDAEEDTTMQTIHASTGGDTLLVEGMRYDRTFLKSDENIFSHVSFMFAIQDTDKLQTHIDHHSERRRAWEESVKIQEEKLKYESELNKDILFVNVMDVYRELPQKILQCHKWFYGHTESKFVLKTDDDCVVNLDKILKKLNTLEDVQKLWWGQFRDEWLVERHGKWQEKILPSYIYPRFACGSGNILSGDLHQWIVNSSAMLEMYQGEDVSLGVWLSAVGPNFIRDPSWQCSGGCIFESYVVPELSPEKIKESWLRMKRCGDFCPSKDCPV